MIVTGLGHGKVAKDGTLRMSVTFAQDISLPKNTSIAIGDVYLTCSSPTGTADATTPEKFFCGVSTTRFDILGFGPDRSGNMRNQYLLETFVMEKTGTKTAFKASKPPRFTSLNLGGTARLRDLDFVFRIMDPDNMSLVINESEDITVAVTFIFKY